MSENNLGLDDYCLPLKYLFLYCVPQDYAGEGHLWRSQKRVSRSSFM